METLLGSPRLKALSAFETRFEPFPSVAAVRLFDQIEIYKANHFATSGALKFRTFRHRDCRDDSVCWQFEDAEDAVLFYIKFGGASETPTQPQGLMVALGIPTVTRD